MSVVAFLRHGSRLLVPLAVACTIYLYLFPFFQGCAFPVESGDRSDAFAATKALHWPFSSLGAAEPPVANSTANDKPAIGTKLAPFRLLALGDPQLEGDTSIPTTYRGVFPHWKELVSHVTFTSYQSCLRERVRKTLHEIVDIWFEDLPFFLESYRKRIDLFGNDFYLAHIYRTVHWWSKPTHVSVLGDLLGSQWIGDEEFERRGSRFWNRSFKGTERLSDELAAYPTPDSSVAGYLNGSDAEKAWTTRLLNVAGNHDIGYAGDLTTERLQRFERLFGKTNYQIRFQLPVDMVEGDERYQFERLVPEIRIVGLNNMNLDTPAKEPHLQDETYAFINDVIANAPPVESKGCFTLVLSHIPLYKTTGICVDEPFFDFHPESDGSGVREQNQLSADASKGYLEGLFGMSGNMAAGNEGMGRPGLMLNGHDHEGCDTYHFINQTAEPEPLWEVKRWNEAQESGLPGAPAAPGRREITVRSMMGGFGGNAGLLSMWFDEDAWEWRFEYAECPLGTQHFWWFVHILDLGVVVWLVVYGVVLGLVAAGVDVDGAFRRHVSCCIFGGQKEAGAKATAKLSNGSTKQGKA